MSEVDISEDLNKIVDNELQTEFENILKIVNSLNELEKIIEPKNEYQSPLEVSKNDNLAAYKLVQVKIRYLKEKLLFDNSTKLFSLKVFELLFLKRNELNYDRLGEKIDIFQVVLSTYISQEKAKKKQKDYINIISKEKPKWINLIDTFSVRLTFLGYIFCVFLHYSENLEPILDFIYNYLQLLYDFSVNYSPKELEKIDEEKVSKVFASIIAQEHINYFQLFIEDGELKEKYINPTETAQAINEESQIDFEFNNINLNKKKK